MQITEILARNARMYGHEIALVEREPAVQKRLTLTWQEFYEQSNKLANFLISQGIQKGDRVVLLMMNCLEWLPMYFGILRAGAVAVPLNFRFQEDDIVRCVSVAEAKAVIFGEEFIYRITSGKSFMDQSVVVYIYVG